tara:strand:- start:125 stop:835 length:711 start_codon:yes stop_codon:yes gene_type:complete
VQNRFNHSKDRKEWMEGWKNDGSAKVCEDRRFAKASRQQWVHDYHRSEVFKQADSIRKKKPESRERQRERLKLDRIENPEKYRVYEANKQAKIKSEPGRKLANQLRLKLLKALKGTWDSKRLRDHSDFAGIDDVQSHFASKMTGCMTLANHGSVWHIEHGVAICWYDHDDPEDVQRCWSKANLSAMLASENREKWYKIDDAIANSVGPSNWPKSWNGVLPTHEEREAMYRDIHGSK